MGSDEFIRLFYCMAQKTGKIKWLLKEISQAYQQTGPPLINCLMDIMILSNKWSTSWSMTATQETIDVSLCLSIQQFNVCYYDPTRFSTNLYLAICRAVQLHIHYGVLCPYAYSLLYAMWKALNKFKFTNIFAILISLLILMYSKKSGSLFFYLIRWVVQ